MIKTMSKKSTRKKTSGFTLIELLIGIAIVGVIAAIALPSYFETVQKNRRIDATETLMRLAVLQEQHFSQYGIYADDLKPLNGGTAESSQGYYKISHSRSMEEGKDLTYKFALVAETINGQEADTQCRYFIINSKNKRYSRDSRAIINTTENCW